MKTIALQAEITPERMLKLEVACDIPPGPVEVVLVIHPRDTSLTEVRPGWDDLYGLGQEVWQGMDPKDYVQQLREDRDTRP
jgi:hypothetical protein